MKQKKHKGLFVGILLGAIALIAFGSTFFIYKKNNTKKESQQKNITIVTSFYPMYIATLNVTDQVEGVEVVSLSEPQTGCLHDYQLTPEDMKLLSTADVFVVNGGGIESFLEEVASAYPDLVIVEACQGIDMIEDNAHVWMSVSNYKMQVQNIADGLSAVDVAHDAIYQNNAADYKEQLEELESEIADVRAMMTDGQPVILLHEAYEYLADDLGLEVVHTLDLDEERQVSAGEVKDVMSAVEKHRVRLVFAEENYGKEMGERITEESAARTIYLDPLVRGDLEKDSYITHMRENIQSIQMGFAGR